MSKIDELISGEISSIGISGHIRPDGDCVGAVLSMYHYIRRQRPDVQVDVYLQTVPARFLTVPGIDRICTDFGKAQVYDLFFALDSGDLERLGPAKSLFDSAKKTVCIDHHISNRGYADQNLIEPEIGSTCEILYTMMEDEKLDTETAVCLYLGMAHDTGVFQYSNTTPRTLRIAARLMERGVVPTELIDETFYKKTYVQTQIMGRALMESMLIFEGRGVVSVITQKEMQFFGADGDSMDGIVNQLQKIRGIDVAIFMYETESQVFKVSMRSNEMVDVSKVAAFFGGGGHKRAAGCTVTGSFHDVVNNVTLHIQEQFER